MSLERRDKELAAIGASIGANCRPCIEHHLAAGREAGLSDVELTSAVATAHATRAHAVALLSVRIDELLGHGARAPEPVAVVATSRAEEFVALGASLGANSHVLLRAHIDAALDAVLTASQVKSALKMAGYVQQRASELTAEEVARALGAARATAESMN